MSAQRSIVESECELNVLREACAPSQSQPGDDRRPLTTPVRSPKLARIDTGSARAEGKRHSLRVRCGGACEGVIRGAVAEGHPG